MRLSNVPGSHTPCELPSLSVLGPREGLLIIFLVPPVTGSLEERSCDPRHPDASPSRVLSPGAPLSNPSFLIRSFSHMVQFLIKMFTVHIYSLP